MEKLLEHLKKYNIDLEYHGAPSICDIRGYEDMKIKQLLNRDLSYLISYVLSKRDLDRRNVRLRAFYLHPERLDESKVKVLMNCYSKRTKVWLSVHDPRTLEHAYEEIPIEILE